MLKCNNHNQPFDACAMWDLKLHTENVISSNMHVVVETLTTNENNLNCSDTNVRNHKNIPSRSKTVVSHCYYVSTFDLFSTRGGAFY